MIRVYVVCEGLTEAVFVRELLTPHLESLHSGGAVVHSPPVLGGVSSYAKLKRFVRKLLHTQDPEIRVTTMIDLFKFPQDFSGFADSGAHGDPQRWVEALENRFGQDIQDSRFLPYLQLHEFEALLLTDVRRLTKYYPNRRAAVEELASDIESAFESPEQVNRLMPPSYRIKAAIPEYQKRLAGALTLIEIGLDRVRVRCPHFSWRVDRPAGAACRGGWHSVERSRHQNRNASDRCVRLPRRRRHLH